MDKAFRTQLSSGEWKRITECLGAGRLAVDLVRELKTVPDLEAKGLQIIEACFDSVLASFEALE